MYISMCTCDGLFRFWTQTWTLKSSFFFNIFFYFSLLYNIHLSYEYPYLPRCKYLMTLIIYDFWKYYLFEYIYFTRHIYPTSSYFKNFTYLQIITALIPDLHFFSFFLIFFFRGKGLFNCFHFILNLINHWVCDK